MTILQSEIAVGSEQYQQNTDALLAQLEAVRAVQAKSIEKSYAAKPKFDKKGKILPHERIRLVLDADSPFIELCGLVGYNMHDDKDGSDAGGGIIAGIGFVSGVRCLVSASNSAIKGGTIAPMGVQKTLRLQKIALEQKLPMLTLAESGGANLNYAAEVFTSGGTTFANQARMSAAGIPQLSVVHGNATAGGAYQPGLSDYVITVRKQTEMLLAGPPLLLAATGEVATAEELGGAEMHSQVAGTAEYLAENDADGIRIAREVFEHLNWKEQTKKIDLQFKEPRYSAEELLGIIPADPKQPLNMKEVVARLVDDSDFLEFKQEYDSHTVCGWAKIGGLNIGIITNNGPITPQGAAKTAQFIHLCEQTQRPLLFLHNTTGFMVGTDAEQNGIIKHGSKLIQAVANATVPKISIVVAGSYGAGNYAMCGRSLSPDFIFAWPNSHVAVMGSAQAGKVLRIVAEGKQKASGMEPNEQMLDFLEQSTAMKLEQQSTALFNTAMLHDDGIIDPRDTRKVLIFLLQTAYEAEHRQLNPTRFGVSRF
ncbi:acyl-CoA carboxylase subunit beta [Acinetobacter sp. ANC 3832]|uniref:acyl-CoA carboxylase subunit beta n=1 Tax=Acinetobacter sp. ANC 3832 TaxID=1977874 RepID=UPI000A3474DC|nr:carboxyl transferase domain-containing protein [Acinetobacter sp. ANC 3832]OTG89905.1 acetyl-CoA carboxylase carboxyltransferase subunit [Acinetobacter sp. ANC 3832]